MDFLVQTFSGLDITAMLREHHVNDTPADPQKQWWKRQMSNRHLTKDETTALFYGSILMRFSCCFR
jgi:hypothetical protein